MLSFEKGGFVLRDGKLGTGAGCCCGGCGDPCASCNQSCLSLAIQGFSGSSEGEECEECDSINGTYTLSRGNGAPPTIIPTIEATTGSGAVITASLVFQPGDGSWTIGSVGIDKKGTCYSADAKFAYTMIGAKVACNDPPVVTVEVERTEPLLEVDEIEDPSPPYGSGLVLTPVYVPAVTTPGLETWSVGSVTVTAAGTDYNHLLPVTFTTKGCSVEIEAASGTIRVASFAPEADSYNFPAANSGASGATATFTWTAMTSPPGGIPHWQCSASVSGGSGYVVGDGLQAYFPPGTFYYAPGVGISPFEDIFIGSVTSVNGSGAITGFAVRTLASADPFLVAGYYTEGAVASVVLSDGGEYYTPGGIKSLTLVDSGTFWSTEPCQYSFCGPSACKVDGENQCRSLSVNIGNDDRKLAVSFDGGATISATLPAEGYPCDSLSFKSEDITSSCPTVGTMTISGAQCSTGPASDSCCDPCSGPCDGENPCPEGCVCVDGECVSSPCSGPCDPQSPCPEGCVCVDGQCTGEAAGVCCVPVCSECRACFFLWDGTDFVFQNEILNGDCGNCPECSTVDIDDPVFGVPVEERIVGQSYPFPACCLDEPIPKTCVEFLNSNDKVTRAQCEAHSSYGASGVWHPGQTCAQNPCVVIESCVEINGCTSDSDCVFQGQDDLAPAGCYCLGYFPAANGEPEQLGTCNANEFP